MPSTVCVPEVEITAAALEFGTVDTVTVLQSLRADAVLHASGDPLGPGSEDIRAQVRAAFADDDPAWFDAVSARFDEVIGAAIAQLRRESMKHPGPTGSHRH